MVENPLSDTKSNRGIVAKNFSTQSRSQAARPFEGTSTSTKNHVLAIMAQRERGIMSNQHTTNDDGTTFITGTNIHSRGARQGAGRHSRFTTTPANNQFPNIHQPMTALPNTRANILLQHQNQKRNGVYRSQVVHHPVAHSVGGMSTHGGSQIGLPMAKLTID